LVLHTFKHSLFGSYALDELVYSLNNKISHTPVHKQKRMLYFGKCCGVALLGDSGVALLGDSGVALLGDSGVAPLGDSGVAPLGDSGVAPVTQKFRLRTRFGSRSVTTLLPGDTDVL
jgi:hypothetical protein